MTARTTYGHGALIACDNLVRIFKIADLEAVALQGLDLLVERGEMVAIVGASGSGKSTLLNILGGLDIPTAGRAVVDGHDLGRLKGGQRTRYRRRTVGMVWQQTSRNLLHYLSAAKNVELPMVLDGRTGRRQRALELLELVGLRDRAHHRPIHLSGGEHHCRLVRQRYGDGHPLLLAAREAVGALVQLVGDAHPGQGGGPCGRW